MGSPAEELAKAGDGLAELLGYAISTNADGRLLDDAAIERRRDVILLWHQIKQAELERDRARASSR